MAEALEGRDRPKCVAHAEADAGLAIVGPGAAESRVAWNHARTRCVAMQGEIYDTAALARSVDCGDLPPDSQAELVLRLYERFGEDALQRLNGAFVVAIWDRCARRVVVFNDRLGLFPLYYASVNGGLLFASGVRALLADPDVDRTVDLVAMNQFLVQDHVLDDRTLLEGVKLLPQATVLTFQGGKLAMRPYWELQYPQVYEPTEEETLIEQFTHYLRQAVIRQKPDRRPAAVLLSGGLDSRMLAAVLCEEGCDVQTLTFGIPGCDDARVAAEVAAALGTRHHFFELKPDWLMHLGPEAVRATDGLGNVVNLHVRATLTHQTRHAQVLYKGFLGDAMFGFAVKRQMWADYSPEDAIQVHRGVHQGNGVLNYSEDEQVQLFTGAFHEQVGDAALMAYREGMRRAGTTQLANQRLYFDLTQRVPRMTLKGVEVAREGVAVRLPFCDNDLLDFALTVPPGFLFDRYLPKIAFATQFPRLAGIPVAGTGRPLRSCARDITAQVKSLASWHLRRYGLGWLAARERRPYKDYDQWFRTVLREWVEDLLLAPRTLERGYFKPEYVRQLVAAHMQGANHAVRLGALLTVELWHRQVLD